MTPVPFLNLAAQNRTIQAELQAALERVIHDASFILGPAVEQFERHFADYIGVRHCIGVNSGTSALHLALQACDIGPGDEVITTPQTWISTSWAISYTGARPVYVDVDPVTYTLDPALVEKAITPRTRAILPVHLYGQAANVLALGRLADKHGLVLIEDTAQAHGARCQGRRLGSFGKAACFSFYPGKNLGAFGEAGVVVTNDDRLAERVRRLRDHAQAGRHHHVEIGYNMRMEAIQAAVLDVKLPYLDRWNTTRAARARLYGELLANVPGLILPAAPCPEEHVWHLYVVQVRDVARQQVRDALARQGIATGVHYPTPVPFQPAYAHLEYRPGSFPVAETVMGRCLSLPLYPELTEEQVRQVADALRACLAQTSCRSARAA
jgi:dTDP-4-amino-4,6-dideoxygalactose transaminase